MSIGNVITTCAIKIAGAAGVGIAAYDAHCKGKRCAKTYSNKKKFEALDYYLNNSRNLPSGSYFNSKAKDKLYDFELKNDFRKFINKPKGYISGFKDMVINDAVPWVLSLTALLVKCTKKIPAPTQLDPNAMKTVMTRRSKVAALALGAYSIYAFAKNICGVGVSKKQ